MHELKLQKCAHQPFIYYPRDSPHCSRSTSQEADGPASFILHDRISRSTDRFADAPYCLPM